MDYRDYYKALGIEREASVEDIKRAYRKLARQYHPDLNKEPGAEARFKEIGEAYEALKDPEKRAAYDSLGAGFQAGQDFRPPPGWDAGFERAGAGSSFDAPDFSEFFENLFGRRHTQGPRGGFQARGEDHHAKVQIGLEDAYAGATRTITLRTAELGEDGRPHWRERSLNVQIPRGTGPGQHIRLAGQGGPGLGGGPAGDLYLEVEFAPHPLYRVEGRDVILDLPVTPWEAALGGKVKVPTPSGAVNLTLKPGTRAGMKLRLKERGLPGTPPGDFLAVVEIVLPPADSDEARRLYAEMAEKLAFNPRAGLGV